MKFGETLRRNTHEPWRESYLAYDLLKGLLREGGEDGEWAERDESRFVTEMDGQLEKVYAHQSSMYSRLKSRIEAKAEEKTEEMSLAELDEIMEEVKELEKFNRLNYSGFLKIAKKHDRHHPRYRVRPLLHVRMSALPFNSEDYGPLLRQLSLLYARVNGDSATHGDVGTTTRTYKFWVHPDNEMEVKTFLLRRLPVLVYNPHTLKSADASDPTITSLYFDNPEFQLYLDKLQAESRAHPTLRLRWYGRLSPSSPIFLEKKWDEEVERLQIKEKYIQPFLQGEYAMEKTVEKMRIRGIDVAPYFSLVTDFQNFIRSRNLQPMLAANYTRTAFQIPGDDTSIRASLDSNLALVRCDAMGERPCRDPSTWHRADMEEASYPFPNIREGEITRFPFCLLQITLPGREPTWVADLRASHLVYEAGSFSKYLHGVATLFENEVNFFPFWLADMEKDIRRDPQEEAETPEFLSERIRLKDDLEEPTKSKPDKKEGKKGVQVQKPAQALEGSQGNRLTSQTQPKVRVRIPPAEVILPPGVHKPKTELKNTGPVKVETKVWLANQRTFIKWQQISVLLFSLSLALFNAAAGRKDSLATILAGAYTLIAILTALWGWGIYQHRSRQIYARSGKHFDNVVGPIAVCVCLVVALCCNFYLAIDKFNRIVN